MNGDGRTHFLLYILLLLVLNSCVTYPPLHTAVSENVPMFRQKGEANLSIASGTETFGVQGSLAITKSIAIIGGYSSGNNDILYPQDLYNQYVFGNYRTNWELGLGYYKAIDSLQFYEIFAGVDNYRRGFTLQDRSGYGYNQELIVNITRPFIQQDISFWNSKKNSLGLSLKVGLDVFNHSFFQNFNSDPQFAYKYTDFPNIVDIEPSMIFRFGKGFLNGFIQCGYSPVFYYGPGPFSNTKDDGLPVFLDFGLCLHLK